MRRLVENKDLSETMSDKNLEDIKQKDWPLIAKQITDVYFKIV